MPFLRRFGAALKMALLWALVGGFIGAVLGTGTWWIDPIHRRPDMNFPFWNWVGEYAFPFGIVTFLAGTIFSVSLVALRGRLSIDKLRYRSVALNSGLLGSLIGLVFYISAVTLGQSDLAIGRAFLAALYCGILSGSVATGILAVARRAPELPGEREEPELLSP